jgi:hypothetical protein
MLLLVAKTDVFISIVLVLLYLVSLTIQFPSDLAKMFVWSLFESLSSLSNKRYFGLLLKIQSTATGIACRLKEPYPTMSYTHYQD